MKYMRYILQLSETHNINLTYSCNVTKKKYAVLSVDIDVTYKLFRQHINKLVSSMNINLLLDSQEFRDSVCSLTQQSLFKTRYFSGSPSYLLPELLTKALPLRKRSLTKYQLETSIY